MLDFPLMCPSRPCPLIPTFPPDRGDGPQEPRTETLALRRKRHAEEQGDFLQRAQTWWNREQVKAQSEYANKFTSLDEMLASDCAFPGSFWRWIASVLALPYECNDDARVDKEGRPMTKSEAYSVETVVARFQARASAHNRLRPECKLKAEDGIVHKIVDYIPGELKTEYHLKGPLEKDFATWDDVLRFGRSCILGPAWYRRWNDPRKLVPTAALSAVLCEKGACPRNILLSGRYKGRSQALQYKDLKFTLVCRKVQ